MIHAILRLKTSLRRRVLCQEDEAVCDFPYDNDATFCARHPIYCLDEIEKVIPGLIRNHTTLNRSWKYAQDFGFQRKNLFRRCFILNGKNTRRCEGEIDVQYTDMNMNPNNCFVIESHLHEPESERIKMPTTTVYRISLKLMLQDNIDENGMNQVYIAMHDSLALANPFSDGYALNGGFAYKIRPSQVINERLKAPYGSNCTDYMIKWKKNGGSGPVDKKMCVEKCKLDEIMKANKCLPFQLSLPHNYTLCPLDHDFSDKNYDLSSVARECDKKCPDACRDTYYTLRIETIPQNTEDQCAGETRSYCLKRRIFVDVVFNQMLVTTFKHQPKFESVEVFSYIGGYMGMWLGLSLMTLFDFCKTLGELAYYPFRAESRESIKPRDFRSKLFHKRYA